MSNSTPTHSPKLISKRKKEKKNRERKESRDQTCCPRRERERERERDRKGQRTEGTMLTSELADRPDLISVRDRGQRQQQRKGGLRRT